MPILCFEGPSAVGKTTTAAALAATRGAADMLPPYVVPEVNLLFERPEDEAPAWYVERQAERWALAAEAARDGRLVVLDGDPFQPLWYNWAYGFAADDGRAGWQSLDVLEAFYRPRLVRGEMSFPDRYVVFGASEAVLRARKEGDRTRRRGGFEAHLRFVGPQRRYFEAVETASPGRVRFVDAETVDENVRVALGAAQGAVLERRPVELFDHLIRWLRQNRAARPG